MKFDISKFQFPNENEIDFKATRFNLQTFLAVYQSARERVNQPRIPKITQSFNLVPYYSNLPEAEEAEQILLQKERDQEEFQKLHELFTRGYFSIFHLNPEKTERRRSIFFLRYLSGVCAIDVQERLFVGKDIVTKESKQAIIQFCNELGLIVFK